MNGKTLAGIVLVAIGGMMLLGMLGIHVGGLFHFIIAGILIYFGIKKLKEHHQVSGIILLVIGILFLAGAIPFLFGTLIAVVCIFFGWRLMKRNSFHGEPAHAYCSPRYTHEKANDIDFDSDFDKEWNDIMNRKNDKEEN
ncbi:MAG TPA: hypothetical protein VFK44_03960 [Bacillales bacterium]|nr:hypothetical protein [Bacillales bacterium]